MNGVIAHLKRAVESLQKLEEIFGPSKRTAAGVLDDLSEWKANEDPRRHLDQTEIFELPLRTVTHVRKVERLLHNWEMNCMSRERFEYSLKATANFARNDLEDCILGLQAAIQILEEEERHE